MATTLSSIAEKASLLSPVPATITHESEYEYDGTVSFFMNIIKVNVEEAQR